VLKMPTYGGMNIKSPKAVNCFVIYVPIKARNKSIKLLSGFVV